MGTTPRPGTAAVPTQARRRAIGISAEKLARLADVSTSLIRFAEGGYRPSREMADQIEAALAHNTAARGDTP